MRLKSLDHTIRTEILVIGGGFAGCFAAIKAKQAGRDVLVVDKGYISRSCQSMYPSGNIGVCLPDHDKGLWIKELIEGGEYINDQEWVKIQVEETYPLIEELDGLGREVGEEIFIRDRKGEFLRVKVHGDVGTENIVIVGHPLMDALRKKLIKEQVPFLERIAMSDLVIDGERVRGAVGFNYRTGETYLILAQAVILAAAGCNFRLDLTRKNMTGEGQAMAYEAGAPLRNLDIIDGSRHKVLEDRASYFLTFVFGWGGKYMNALGEEFMPKYDPKYGNLTTTMREYACLQEEKAGRGPIYFDLTGIPLEKQLLLKKIRPENFKITQALGKDAFKDRFELQKGKVFAPQGTVSNGGGVDIDTRCATRIQGLYAVGDNACAPQQGTHGVGGQNLAFCVTSGSRGARFAAEYVSGASPPTRDKTIISQAKEHVNRLSLPLLRTEGISPDEITWKIQSLLIPFDQVVSHKKSLETALVRLEKIKNEDFPSLKASDYHHLEKALGVRSILTIAEGMLKSMLFREESRGFLVREDFPMTDNMNWLKWVIVELKDGQMHLSTREIPTPYVEPPRTAFRPKQRRTPV